jgi:hypothetical protein
MSEELKLENIKALMRGQTLNNYQQALALDEYVKLEERATELEKEVKRLSEFEKFCTIGAAKIVNDHVKTKAENKKFKNLSYNDWIKLATPSGVIILLEAFGYDWEDDYNDYEEFGNAVEELIKN